MECMPVSRILANFQAQHAIIQHYFQTCIRQRVSHEITNSTINPAEFFVANLFRKKFKKEEQLNPALVDDSSRWIPYNSSLKDKRTRLKVPPHRRRVVEPWNGGTLIKTRTATYYFHLNCSWRSKSIIIREMAWQLYRGWTNLFIYCF